VAQGVGPEFKLLFWKKKKKERKRNQERVPYQFNQQS
jgi:hypothetical protein